MGFPAAKKNALIDFRNLASNLSIALPVTLALALGLKLIYPSKPCLCSPRMSLYFISLFLIGPTLIVNGVLKSFWGRPRPVSVIDFGGMWPFHEAWVIADHGWLNRSFSSGEAATVACLLPLTLFVPRPWRVQVVTLVGVLVAATSLNRIAFGAHFLSDVTISICLMLVISVVLHRVFFVTHAAALSDEVLEQRLTVIGLDWAGRRAALRARTGRMVADGVNALARVGHAQLRSARAVAATAASFIATRRDVGRRMPLTPR
ncbi:phosphatase PAP2 family protein [Ancylobacter amanitiformis]|uniref:Membrane-associated phospholipid phosphatase n=1 Tax=Ancylobacter amanitiformis TaxID=217069 RepID=A0ABU0LNV3_9HYPH|nr:phosphatase PAP2 family protein [Ancylobacter amanitiformis]MDQ0510344.1 membrane-associated phospholipid phosphatase [Ancylobacter amanitiformis]